MLIIVRTGCEVFGSSPPMPALRDAFAGVFADASAVQLAAEGSQYTDAGVRAEYDTSEARSRLDQRRFSRPNTHFTAFFKSFKKIIFSQANLQKICQNYQKFAEFFKIVQIFLQNFDEFCKIL